MPVDPERLPDILVPFAEAIEVVAASCRHETGYHAYGFPEAPRQRGDQALYECCVNERTSQRINRDEAYRSLTVKIEGWCRW